MSVDRRVRPTFAESVGVALVLLYQWSVVRRLHNGAFVDEATYVVAGRLLRAAAVPASTFAAYFSGAPVLYPPLAAFVDSLGALDATRAVSLVCIWLATVGVFFTTRRLFATGVGAVAAAGLFALGAPTMFVARLATYDAPVIALLAGGMAVAAHAAAAATQRRALGLAALAGALAGLAVATKYAALLYAPSLLAVVLLAPSPASRSRAWRAVAFTTAAACVVAVIVFACGASEMAHGFLTTTATRAMPSGDGAAAILRFAASLGGGVIALAVPAPFLVSRDARVLAVVLLVTSVLAPLNHARLHEMVSLHKHVAFGALFAAPLAGATIARAVTWGRRAVSNGQGVLALTTLVAATFALLRFIVLPAGDAAERLYTYWPSVTPRVYALLRPVVRPGAHFLDEEPDLGPYYLAADTRYAQWVHPYFFRYASDSGPAASGRAAYVQALRDGYFDAVVLRYGPQRAWARVIEDELLASQPRYRLAARVPFTIADGNGAYEVWVRSDAPGAADVR